MAADLQFVEIPGFRDALKRESLVRRQGWVGAHAEIAGVRVRFLTLRDMVLLEEMQNGFFCPWRFDTDAEFLGHAAHLVWWLSDCPKPPTNARTWFQPRAWASRARLLEHLKRRPVDLANDVRAYIEDAYLDAPRCGGTGGSPLAATPAYIADTLAAGGFALSLDEILDMPVTRLWQLVRLAARRVYGTPATNASDKLACDYLAGISQGTN